MDGRVRQGAIDGEAARALIADHLGVHPRDVVDEASFRALGADSLDLISLTMRIEEAFDIEIADDQAESCVTVGDAMSLLVAACSGPARATPARSVSD